MNHRRNRTTRREIKRMDSKTFRMAEKEALDRPPSVPPSDCWGRGAELPIPDDAPSNGKRRSKRVPKPKERCSKGGSHKFVKVWSEQKDYFRRTLHGYCAKCEELSGDWKRHTTFMIREGYRPEGYYDDPYSTYDRWAICHDHGEKVFYTIRKLTGTCSKCGKTHLFKSESDAYALRYPKARRNNLPRREVKLY